jgi:hypothetical protein
MADVHTKAQRSYNMSVMKNKIYPAAIRFDPVGVNDIPKKKYCAPLQIP